MKTSRLCRLFEAETHTMSRDTPQHSCCPKCPRKRVGAGVRECGAPQTQVDLLRNQVANAEGRAFLSSNQGLQNAAKEAEAKANRLRKEYQLVSMSRSP